MRALIVGPGKMGREIESVLAARGHVAVRRAGRNDPLFADKAPAADLAFEFTTPESAPRLVTALLEHGLPVVSGTTGWDPRVARDLARERGVPFLHSPNFSVGVAAVRRAARFLSECLARFPEFEPGILERHHAAKKDAPSGTARALGEEIATARPSGVATPIVSLRQGGQPGEHAVFFEGRDESVELWHRARSRAVFALGAVCAAEWLLHAGPRGPATFDEFLERRVP